MEDDVAFSIESCRKTHG